MLYSKLIQYKNQGKKLLAVLIDPEKFHESEFESWTTSILQAEDLWIFVGGSTASNIQVESCLQSIRKHTRQPCILFPGHPDQVSPQADAILYLSLVSGRNPEYLIGHQIRSARFVKNSGLEVIPTAYILLDGGHVSAVQRVSQTAPMSQEQVEEVVDTAIGAELLGMKAVYLEAGSGAQKTVKSEIIQHVSQQVSVPLIVGGGIKSAEQMHQAFDAGADVVVVGTAIEKDTQIIQTFQKAILHV